MKLIKQQPVTFPQKNIVDKIINSSHKQSPLDTRKWNKCKWCGTLTAKEHCDKDCAEWGTEK